MLGANLRIVFLLIGCGFVVCSSGPGSDWCHSACLLLILEKCVVQFERVYSYLVDRQLGFSLGRHVGAYARVKEIVCDVSCECILFVVYLILDVFIEFHKYVFNELRICVYFAGVRKSPRFWYLIGECRECWQDHVIIFYLAYKIPRESLKSCELVNVFNTYLLHNALYVLWVVCLLGFHVFFHLRH